MKNTLGAATNPLLRTVQCCNCQNKHRPCDRPEKPFGQNGSFVWVCPECGHDAYWDLEKLK